MNKALLKKIELMPAILNEFAGILEAAAESEQERYDNLSERSQESEKGERLQEIIDILSDSASDMYDIASNIEDAISE